MSLYEFGPFQLDATRLLLLEQGEPIPIGPKVVETLLALIEHPGEVFPKGELLARIWPEGYVDEANLAQNVYVLRKTLRRSWNVESIETIPRRGYRFVATVQRRDGVPPALRLAIVAVARDLYRGHPHPGVHAAAGLLLRRWGDAEFLAQADGGAPVRLIGRDGKGWERGPNGHTFAILPAPLEFAMGAPPHEPGHYGNPIRHHRRIDRSLAVATKEVTVAQLRAFDPGYRPDPRYGAEPDCAASHVSWFAAVRYCNRLSEKLGLDPSQWCYPKEVGPGMVLAEDALADSLRRVDRAGPEGQLVGGPAGQFGEEAEAVAGARETGKPVVLDLARRDVLAAARDHDVFLAIDDAPFVGVVGLDHVPGMQPAVNQNRLRALLIFPVTAKQARTSYE